MLTVDSLWPLSRLQKKSIYDISLYIIYFEKTYIFWVFHIVTRGLILKVLEITPLKDKKLNVLIVEKEYNETFWLVEPPSTMPLKRPRSILRPSIAFCTFIERLIKRIKPDFATEELGMRSSKEFYENNILAKIFQRNNVPFFPVDIDEQAKAYLEASLDERRQLRDEILDTLEKLPEREAGSGESSMERDYLIAYAQSLQQEFEEELNEVCFPVRERWIVMGILDGAREVSGKEEVTCLHICSPEHVEGVKNLLESLDAKVEVIKVSKRVISPHPERSISKELTDLLQSMRIQVKPIIRKTSSSVPSLLFFLDTDRRASPFDICMAYDAGFSAVIPYENVTLEDAKKIVQDAMFSRGPKGAKSTCFFIGGKSKEKAEEVLETVKNTMFPPFICPIIIDPGGAYTTAAAMVAKVENALSTHKLGSLGDKTCAIFGTGPVGRVVAVLLARLGCDVIIASTNPKRSDGEEYIENVARSLFKRHGTSVQGVYAPRWEDRIQVLKKADVIFCAVAPGIRVIEADMLKELKLMKVMVDINAVPPLGIEGMKLEDDMREIAPGIFGIGPLTIGKLKHKLEIEILREARKNGEGIYDYNSALQLARKLLRGRITPKDLAFTLTYPA